MRDAFLGYMTEEDVRFLTLVKHEAVKCNDFIQSKFADFVSSCAYINWSWDQLDLRRYVKHLSIPEELVATVSASRTSSSAVLTRGRDWAGAIKHFEGVSIPIFMTLVSEAFPLVYANPCATRSFCCRRASELYERPNPLIADRGTAWIRSAMPTKQSVPLLGADGMYIQTYVISVPVFDSRSKHRYSLSFLAPPLSRDAMFCVAFLLSFVPRVIF